MKRLILAAALVAAVPAFAITIQRWQTNEGTTVLFVERHENPIVDIHVSFKGSGSAADPLHKNGTAQFTAALLTSGTQRQDEETFKARGEDLAIGLTSSADTEGSGISMRSLSQPQTLQPALNLLHEAITEPRYDRQVFKRMQEQAALELQQQHRNPSFLAAQAAARLNYPNHPYSADAYQSEQSLRAVTPQDAQAFHRTHYAHDNAVVSIVGDVNRQQADRIAHEILKGLPEKAQAISTIPPVGTHPAQTANIPFDSKQAQVVLSMPLIKRDDPDYYALILGNYILGGGGFDSRLMKKMRDEKGYVYNVSSSMNPQSEAGEFTISFATQKANVQAALTDAKHVLAEFIQNGPTESELQQAQSNITGSFPLRLDTNKKLLGYLSIIGFYNLPSDWLDRYPERINALSTKEIKQAWQRRVDTQNMNTVIVGR